MQPLALALRDHVDKAHPVDIEFRRDDGEIYRQSSEDYFAAPDDLDELEAIALQSAKAPVLDVGAGCGRLTLLLQATDIAVTALDVSPDMVALMRSRGVQHVIQGDALTIDTGHYATILMLMETVGLAGDVDRLGLLLHNLSRRLTPTGQIVCDACPLIETGATASVQLQIRYGVHVGPIFDWLYVDMQTFAEVAAQHGLSLEIGYLDEDNGHYLARLRHLRC